MDIKETLLDIYSDGGEWDDMEPIIDDALARIAALEVSLKEAVDMLKEAHDHLEYCGYGDKWERECAREDKLDERIVNVLQKYLEKE